jgi:predicted ATPase
MAQDVWLSSPEVGSSRNSRSSGRADNSTPIVKRLFQRFDRLLLLAKGGRTVYFGEVGRGSSTLIDYFNSAGLVPGLNCGAPLRVK